MCSRTPKKHRRRRRISSAIRRTSSCSSLWMCVTKIWSKAISNTWGSRGPIDYIFCNAGVGFGQAFTVTKREDWNTVFDVNLFGVVNCVHAVVPIMIEQGHGHIVNVASVCGIVPLPYQTVYAASKYAVVGFGEDLRYEMSYHNIKVDDCLSRCGRYDDLLPLSRLRDSQRIAQAA